MFAPGRASGTSRRYSSRSFADAGNDPPPLLRSCRRSSHRSLRRPWMIRSRIIAKNRIEKPDRMPWPTDAYCSASRTSSPQPLGADQGCDDDHRQAEQNGLVHPGADRGCGEGQIHLRQQVPVRGPVSNCRLADRFRHALAARGPSGRTTGVPPKTMTVTAAATLPVPKKAMTGIM